MCVSVTYSNEVYTTLVWLPTYSMQLQCKLPLLYTLLHVLVYFSNPRPSSQGWCPSSSTQYYTHIYVYSYAYTCTVSWDDNGENKHGIWGKKAYQVSSLIWRKAESYILRSYFPLFPLSWLTHPPLDQQVVIPVCCAVLVSIWSCYRPQ